MKSPLMAIIGLLGGSVAYTVAVTPGNADYGKASVGAFVTRRFTINRSDTLRTIVALEGQDAREFFLRGPEHDLDRGEADTLYGCWNESVGRSLPTCQVSVDFRPTAEGVKTATLVVTDAHGQKATATLRGEAVVPDCKLELVACNWAVSYIGGINIFEVDSSITSERVAKYVTDLAIVIDQGRVTCSGKRSEFEQSLEDDKPTDELQFKATISGPGLAAIEFEPDQNGRMTYSLNFACATPAGTRISRSLRFGTSETDTVAAEPPDWRNAQLVGEPQPATEQGMPLLEGKHLFADWDPANKEGHVIRSCWSLSRKGTRAASPTVGTSCSP